VAVTLFEYVVLTKGMVWDDAVALAKRREGSVVVPLIVILKERQEVRGQSSSVTVGGFGVKCSAAPMGIAGLKTPPVGMGSLLIMTGQLELPIVHLVGE
jgi:hypothetical protein